MTRPSTARALRWILALGALGAVAVNGIAASQAWRMTHFVDGGVRTRPPEKLDLAERLRVTLLGVELPRPIVGPVPTDPGIRVEEERVEVTSAWVFPGAGRGVAVLLHGYGASRADMVGRAELLHDHGWTTVLPDLPGAGDSDGDVTSLGWHEAEVAARLVAAHRGEGPLILVGASLGSAASLRAVGDLGAPVDALILENPYDRLVTTVGHRFEAMGLPAWPGAPLLVFWGGLELGFDGFALNPVESATRVHAPTLLLHGAKDTRVHPEEMEAIRDALPGPRELVWFPTAAHEGLYAADPALWTVSVLRFLATYAPPPAPSFPVETVTEFPAP